MDKMLKSKNEMQRYEDFLSSLILEPELFSIKSVEMDLKGDLNPTHELNDLFFTKTIWVNFQEFFMIYLEKHEKKLKELCKDWDSFMEGLRARLYRTQFGFLTEYHAYFLAQHIFGRENVKRSIELDMAGVDFQIIRAGIIYNIHIFVDTERAWSYRRFKSEHKFVEKIPGTHVNLPYCLKPGYIHSLRYLINGFGIYTQKYIEYLRNEMIKGHIKNNNVIGVDENGFRYTP